MSRNQPSSLVLLSGGLDSSANLCMGLDHFQVRTALFIDYGQRARERERRSSQMIAKHFGVFWREVKIDFLKDLGGSSLTDYANDVPVDHELDITSQETSLKSAARVWVPNRNGLFIALAAALADRENIDFVIPGFNREEASTFPDNSKEFLKVASEGLAYSTRHQVKLHCLTIDWDKSEIISQLKGKRFPFHLLWPCYFGGETWCGKCESCLRFKRALEAKAPEFQFMELAHAHQMAQ